MAIQLIFCLETKKSADTDWIYIKETIDYYFVVNNQVKLNKVYMNTKTRYKSKDVLKDIDKKTKEFEIGDTIVIYCVDTDEFEKNINHEQELMNVSAFCKTKNYELIWFCHDVEEVFWGHKVSDSLKVKEAAKFRNKKMIKQIDENNLSSEKKVFQKSNLISVLQNYLLKK